MIPCYGLSVCDKIVSLTLALFTSSQIIHVQFFLRGNHLLCMQMQCQSSTPLKFDHSLPATEPPNVVNQSDVMNFLPTNGPIPLSTNINPTSSSSLTHMPSQNIIRPRSAVIAPIISRPICFSQSLVQAATDSNVSSLAVLEAATRVASQIQGMNKAVQDNPTAYDHMEAERLVGIHRLENDPAKPNTLRATAISTKSQTTSKREVTDVDVVSESNSEVKLDSPEAVKSSITAEVKLEPNEVAEHVRQSTALSSLPATEPPKNNNMCTMYLTPEEHKDFERWKQKRALLAATSTKSQTGSKRKVIDGESELESKPKAQRKKRNNDGVATSTSSTAVKPTAPVENADFKHGRGTIPTCEIIELDADEPVKSKTAGVKMEPPEAVKSITSEVKLESKPFKASVPPFLIKARREVQEAREMLERAEARAAAEAAKRSVVPEPVTSAVPEPVSSGGVSSTSSNGGVVDLSNIESDED